MIVNTMTIDQFKKVPYRQNWQGDIECDSLIIMPSEINHKQLWVYKLRKWLSQKWSWIKEPELYDIEGMHDSGYRKMDFVLIKDGKPLCRASGNSDVLHIGGIGGYGLDDNSRRGFFRDKVESIGWCIDCLEKSGLLRLFTGNTLVVGSSLSSFEVWVNKNI